MRPNSLTYLRYMAVNGDPDQRRRAQERLRVLQQGRDVQRPEKDTDAQAADRADAAKP
jgi:hypothetical protein